LEKRSESEKRKQGKEEWYREEKEKRFGWIHVFFDFFCAHSSTENGRSCEVTSVTRINWSHHVLGIEHLLCEFTGEVVVANGIVGDERSKSNQEEMETREGNQVHSKLSEITVQLCEVKYEYNDSEGEKVGGEIVTCPGKRRQHVIPDITELTKRFKSP
jgi:hypothetical protein